MRVLQARFLGTAMMLVAALVLTGAPLMRTSPTAKPQRPV